MTTAIAVERWGRVRTGGEKPTLTYKYYIYDAADDEAAETALLAEAPSSVGLFEWDSQEVSEIDGGGKFYGEVRYVYSPNVRRRKEIGDSTYSFDTTGGTARITHSLDITDCYAAEGATVDAATFDGAIGVRSSGNGQREIEGVEIRIPVYKWTETHYLAAAAVDQAYKVTLCGLTGKVNAATFRGFAAGEVLFGGAQGSERGDGTDWEISFQFEASPNVTGLAIGSITGIAKGGWQYLWALTEHQVDGTSNLLVPKVIAVYVQDVYQSGDFTGLGIG